jgi:hypothetical protein
MTLQAPQRLVIADQAILIPVWLIKSNNLANLNFEVKYDPSVVRSDGKPIPGNLLSNALPSMNAQEAGVIRVGLAQRRGTTMPSPDPPGTVVNIPFRAVGKPGARTALELTVTTINDPNGGVLTIDRINGEILIMDQDGTFPPSSGTGNNGPGNPSSGTGNNDPGNPSSGSGSNGPGNPGGGPIVIPRGNCEGEIVLEEIDALCALDMSTGLRQPVSLIMDMDRSGDVTSRDAVLILQQLVNQL